jgi:hypothetical protein
MLEVMSSAYMLLEVNILYAKDLKEAAPPDGDVLFLDVFAAGGVSGVGSLAAVGCLVSWDRCWCWQSCLFWLLIISDELFNDNIPPAVDTNLPYDAHVKEIQDLCQEFAPIDKAVVPRDQNGLAAEYAFVYL